MNELSNRLKNAIVSDILNKKQNLLDEHYVTSSQGSFTRRELAEEIKNETEVGMQVVEDILKLTLDLLHRQKETI